MEKGLVVSNSNAQIPSEHEMMVYHTMAVQAITSKMYGNNFKDKSAVMMIMLSARELGIPPMQALNGGINLIQGKVEISARMMSALIRKAGHQIQVKECTTQHCILVGKRSDTGEVQSSSFSVAEAQLAGLIKPGGGWIKWPKDMCFARALSRLARQLFSDVIGIGYVEGEISHQSEEKIYSLQEAISDDLIVEEKTESEEDLSRKFLLLFKEEDLSMAEKWLQVIEKHYEWTRYKAMQEILKDESKVLDKFNAWKTKQTKETE